MIPDFEEVLLDSARHNGELSGDGDREGAPWHLFDIGEYYPDQRPRSVRYGEDALAPEGPSSPEMAGNLYVYLIPSIFKEERGADREEPPRGPSLPAGSRFEERNDRGQRFLA